MSIKESNTKKVLKGCGKDAQKAAVLAGAFVESLNSAYGLGIPREAVVLGTVLLYGAGKRMADYLESLDV